jgi:hypothetical protein
MILIILTIIQLPFTLCGLWIIGQFIYEAL